MPVHIEKKERSYMALYDGITGELKEARCDSAMGVFDVNEREPLLLVAMIWDSNQQPCYDKKTVKYMISVRGQ